MISQGDLFYVYGITLNIDQLLALFSDSLKDFLDQSECECERSWHEHKITSPPTEWKKKPDKLELRLMELVGNWNRDFIYDGYLEWSHQYGVGNDDLVFSNFCNPEDEQWVLGVRIKSLTYHIIIRNSYSLTQIANLNFPGGDKVKAEWRELATKYQITNPPELYHFIDQHCS